MIQGDSMDRQVSKPAGRKSSSERQADRELEQIPLSINHDRAADEENHNEPLLVENKAVDQSGDTLVSYMAGILPTMDALRLKRLIFRSSRGNSLTQITNLDHSPELGETKLSVFIVIFHDSEIMRSKTTKICESLSRQSFDMPGAINGAQVLKEVAQLEIQIKETKTMISQAKKLLRAYLTEEQAKHSEMNVPIQASMTEIYKLFLIKEKIIFEQLNKFKIGSKLYYGFCWCPVSDLKQLDAKI
jgi:vacuolar-type H+-ATPase subunit I/STV1